MGQAEGSTAAGCMRLVAGLGVGFGLLVVAAVLLGDPFEGTFGGFDHLGETGCAESEIELIAAAGTGDLDAVHRELDDGTDPDAVDREGNSALACAGPRGHVAVVTLLLERGASPTTRARDGDTGLGDAVRFCQPEIAELLLGAGADPDSSGREDSLLDQAARVGDPDMVEVLLAGGTDPDSFHGDSAAEPFGNESTSDCPEPTDGGRAATLQGLLDGGADPSAVLGSAAGLPAPVAAPLLSDAIAAGADPDSDSAGPVLAVAAAGRDADVVALLLAAGADPNRSPVDAPDPSVSEPGPSTTTTLPLFDLLGAGGLCTGAIDPVRCDVSRAVRQFSSQTTYGFVDPAEDPDRPPRLPPELSARDRATAMPLMIAAWDGDAEIVQLLLGAGADPRAVDDGGYGPLHAAAAGGDTEVVRLLLAAGGGAPSDGEQVPPSGIARNAGRTELADLLAAVGR